MAFAGCSAPQVEKPEDLQAMMYSQINKLREMNDTEPLSHDPELEEKATRRAADISANDDRVLPVGHDSDVSAEVKAKMVVHAWLEEQELHNIVLNKTIDSFGVGVHKENDRYNIALNVA